ncbi:MAG: hypothetical protein ACON4U_07110 [Myxococcota bacterium]
MHFFSVISYLQFMSCQSKSDSLISAFEAEGFEVQLGAATGFQIEDCEHLDSCFGNNASAPYILFNLPGPASFPDRLPETLVGEIPKVPENLRPHYYLNDNEAVVIVGTSPPQSKYFGLTPYLFSRIGDGTERIPVFASLTDSLNQVNLRTEDGNPYNSKMAVIFTSDSASMANARNALENMGYSNSNINEVILPRSDVEYGTVPDKSDTFLIMGRLALVEEEAAGQRYLQDIPLQVYRLSTEQTGAGLEVDERTPRGDGQNEDHLESGLDQLEDAIYAEAEQFGEVTDIAIASSQIVSQIIDPELCLENTTECKGDNADTTYAAGPLSVIQSDGINTLDEDEYFVVYGVNHTAAGKSTYSNFSVYTQTKKIGVVAVDNTAMAGSASGYLSDNADKYFVYEVRRDCTDKPYCLTLHTDFPGAPLDESLFFIFRAYLNPGLSVSPDHDEILTERVIHVQPF